MSQTITAKATSRPPEGMTAEEAARLVAEADAKQAALEAEQLNPKD